jgi:hypothetical protein
MTLNGPFRRARAAATVACSLAALSAPAFAQSTSQPMTSPSPSPSAAVANENLRSNGRHAWVGHLPIIDVIPVLTWPGSDLTQRQIGNFDYLDVGGTITIPITRSLSFSFDRNVGGTLDQASESYLVGGVRHYPTVSRDSILVERLDFETNGFTFEGGLSFRHRIDGSSGVSTAAYPYTVSSDEWHYGYVGVAYATNPIHVLANSQFTFGLTGEYQPVDQHVAVEHDGRVSFVDENPHLTQYYESTESVGVIVPVGQGLNITARDSWGASDFYENAPFPYRWDGNVMVEITKKFNGNVSLTVRDQNQHWALQGAPVPFPNANHTEAIDLLADFHLDFNKIVHH